MVLCRFPGILMKIRDLQKKKISNRKDLNFLRPWDADQIVPEQWLRNVPQMAHQPFILKMVVESLIENVHLPPKLNTTESCLYLVQVCFLLLQKFPVCTGIKV